MMSTINSRHVAAALRSDLYSFVQAVFPIVSGQATFLPNWHIEAMTSALTKVLKGEIKRLIITVPPRSLKSICASVALPAFGLGHDPTRRFICVSYSEALARKHGDDCRALMRSPLYRRVFPGTRIRHGRDTDTEFATTARGYRLATSVGGTLTGRGGNFIIIDDPLKPQEAYSKAARDAVLQWYCHTLLTRLDNKSEDAIVVVMQRLHLDDLVGYLLEQGGWTHLNLPAIAQQEQVIELAPGRSYARAAGELLHPRREPQAALDEIKHSMGSVDYAAQYQQEPVPTGGAMIQRAWLRYYDELPELTSYHTNIIQSWDTASKDGAHNDCSVCTTWMVVNKHYYLIDLIRGRYDYPRLKANAIALAEKYRPHYVLIEDASTGIALSQELQSVYLDGAVKLVPIERDKIGRLYVNQAKFEAGLVLFPKDAPFLPDLEAELLAFPHGKTDDQVDSLSQALSWQPSYDTTLSWVE
jgi:predicted phage terminase large subunit-like protein